MKYRSLPVAPTFQPGHGHSPAARRRAERAAAALYSFAASDGRIPPARVPAALRAAVLATDRTWSAHLCRVLAHQIRIIAPER